MYSEYEIPRVENPKAKRVWFITDTHFGVRNSSNEWIEIIQDYFFDFFIPLVKKNYRPGDVLIHLGDWYDSRQSVNLRVLNLGVKVAEELSSIFADGIWVLIGNHDIFGKNSNEVNSLKSIKWIPGFNICEEPISLNLGGKSFFMMPWRKDSHSEEETLDNINPHDYLCCHADIRGLKFNRFVNIEHGSAIEKFRKFKTVYSGHIHYSQNVGNIKMLGSPYELTRSDMDNPKGITLLDLHSGEETFFRNEFSPKFKRFNFDEILDKNIDEVNELFNNNFVDIMIDPRMALKAPLNILTDEITNSRKISFHPFDPNQASLLSERINESENQNFDVLDFVDDYINSLDYDEETKSKMYKTIKKLHQLVVNQEMENKL
jgi:calcineurin-like phosphoesterase family protein